MDKGWQAWSAQVPKVQLLRADRENRKAQRHGFLKMSKEAITIVQEDISKDLYEMAAYHKEEVSRIMQEFDKHDVNGFVHLDNLYFFKRVFKQDDNLEHGISSNYEVFGNKIQYKEKHVNPSLNREQKSIDLSKCSTLTYFNDTLVQPKSVPH